MVGRGAVHGFAALVLGCGITVIVACGGPSTAGTRGGLQLTPVGDAVQSAIQVSNLEWAAWKEAGGRFLDRDFLDCYELNGVPRPVATPIPDPSGHTRTRRGCDEAVAAIEKALPDYRSQAEKLKSVKLDDDSPFKEQFQAVSKARTERLAWAQDTVAAWKRNDMVHLNALRLRIPDLALLEAFALGLNPLNVTPEPRPTLDFIPGVPTRTPTP